MSTYAIGDVQGCFDELQELLGRIGFSQTSDRLWFVGDLVNRGPQSLQVLRFVRSLGDRAVTVLGNHDLHLVAQFEGVERRRKADTFHDVLDAPDAAQLICWLRTRPMFHVEDRHAMVHAALLPQWPIAQARSLAQEVERILAGPDYRSFLANMYGNQPERWDDSLAGWERARAIVNVMTRLRFCTADGRMEFDSSGTEPPEGFSPWFAVRPAREEPALVCGHWSSLGLRLTERVALLDSGCVWGGALSALRLEDRWLMQVPCKCHQAIGEGK